MGRRASLNPFQERTPEQEARWQAQRTLADQVYAALGANEQEGLDLMQLLERLSHKPVAASLLRPVLLLEALNMLHHAGLVASSAHQAGDDLMERRYWRASRGAAH